MNLKPVKIDGSMLEGGGQLVRLVVGLSSVTGKPVQIVNIRGRRPKPGLKNQHLTAIIWLAKACGAYTEGVFLGSQTLLFEPRVNQPSKPWWTYVIQLPDGSRARVVDIEVDQGIGAVTLVLQAILPFLLFADCSTQEDNSGETAKLPVLLKLIGGTNVSFSPSVDYLEQVLFPNLCLLGLPRMERSPHYPMTRSYSVGPATAGEVHLLLYPVPRSTTLSPIRFPERGEIRKLDVTFYASPMLTRRLIRQKIMKGWAIRAPDIPIDRIIDIDSGYAKRMGLLLVAYSMSGFRIGADVLFGEKVGSRPDAIDDAVETMVRRAIDRMLEEIAGPGQARRFQGRCLDHHMEDQVPIYMALASGTSACERTSKDENGPSLHQQTCLWVLEELLGVCFDANTGECEGIGLVSGKPVFIESLDGEEQRSSGLEAHEDCLMRPGS